MLNKKRKVLQIVLIFFMYIGLLYILSSVPYIKQLSQDFWSKHFIGCLFYSVTFLFVVLLTRKMDKKPLSSIGLHLDIHINEIIRGLILGIVIFSIPVIPAIAMGYNLSDMGGKLPVDKAFFKTMYYFVFVATVEETVFRGIIYTKLFSFVKSKILVFSICSILFGMSHIINFNLMQFVQTTITSVILCIFLFL